MAADPTKRLRIATIYSYGANEAETDGILDEENRKIPPILTRAAGIFWMPLFRTTTRCSIRTTPLMANGSRITTKMYRSA